MQASPGTESIGIGIDTGGTCTDVVFVDLNSGAVLASAKSSTTHHDLSIGIRKALEKAAAGYSVQGKAVSRIALSTTLATNAMVEGKGADVGLIVAGTVKPFSSPAIGIRFIKGGHTISGEEDNPLDLEEVLEAIEAFRGHVQAYAVCSSMSFVNPSHEAVIEKAISLYDPRPVFCSHEISSEAGMEERSQTAVINARLLPIMEAFLKQVQPPLHQLAPDADIQVLRGDAAFMSLHDAVEHAATTVASGPAATACFGTRVCQDGLAVVVDVGGTTTDITLIENGTPLLQQGGSRIGEWQTHVRAVDMSTIGAGGDSRIRITRDGDIRLGPERVVPLALSDGFPPPETWIGPGPRAICIRALDNETPDPILDWLRAHGPATFESLAAGTGYAEIVLETKLAQLRHRQAIIETGFTPTDALHVLNRLALGSAEASTAGAEILAREAGDTADQWCRSIIRELENTIEDAIIRHLLRYGLDQGHGPRYFPDHRHHPLLRIRFDLKIPIIGIGAASAFFLPDVAKRLETELRLPDHYEVGNALGAIASGQPVPDRT